METTEGVGEGGAPAWHWNNDPPPSLQTDSVWIHFGLGQCKITNGLIRLQHLTVAV